MKKFLKIFFALVALVVIGITALITLVDPNEYRGYMVQKVEEKTGYQLEINGDLRWRIWPHISILVNDVKVTAPGAKDAMLQSENMRLDVALLPLLSKELSVNEILLKGTIIRLTDDTKPVVAEQAAQQPSATTSGGTQSAFPLESLELNRFEIDNGQFVLQQSANKDDVLTVRDINAVLAMKKDRNITLTARAAINRNQQDITASLDASADLQNYPKQASIVINNLAYQVQGAGFPASGIKGNASVKASYSFDSKDFTVSDLKASANGSSFSGNASGSLGDMAKLVAKIAANLEGGTMNGDISATLSDIPDVTITLTGDRIDVDKVMAAFMPASSTTEGQSEAAKAAQSAQDSNPLAFLNDMNSQFSLTLGSLIANGITLSNVDVNAVNKQGNVQLNRLSAQLLGGSVSVPGTINAKGKLPALQLNPKVENIDLETVNKTFNIPQTLSGKLNMTGTMSGSGLSAAQVMNGWNANLNVQVADARLNNLNLQQIIFQAAALTGQDKLDQRYDQYTQVRQLSTQVALQRGNVRLDRLTVDSDALTVAGSGTVGLANMQCDINLNVKLLQAYQGRKEIADILQTTAIPVRIYGPCSNLAYRVDIERIIRDALRNQVRDQVRNQAEQALDRLGGNAEERKNEAINRVLGGIVGNR